MSMLIKGIDMPKEGEMHLIISKNGIICGAEYPAKVKHTYPLNLNAQAIQIDNDIITKIEPIIEYEEYKKKGICKERK